MNEFRRVDMATLNSATQSQPFRNPLCRFSMYQSIKRFRYGKDCSSWFGRMRAMSSVKHLFSKGMGSLMKHCRLDKGNMRVALLLLLIVSLFIPSAYARNLGKKAKKQQQPKVVGIYLVGHLPLSETTISYISATSDSSRQLLQLTDATQRTLTVVDVTMPEQPKLVEQAQLPADLVNSALQTRIGNTALFAATDSSSFDRKDTKSITLVSFADPSNPKTVQKFENVTAVWMDRGRELIYLTNSDGLWVLQIYSEADKRAEEIFDEMFRGAQTGG